jgi:IS5 family transposase
MSTPDFCRSRLDTMIDLRHPLAVLATRMPWGSIEATLAPMFARCAREGRVLEGADLFGTTTVLAARASSWLSALSLPSKPPALDFQPPVSLR